MTTNGIFNHHNIYDNRPKYWKHFGYWTILVVSRRMFDPYPYPYECVPVCESNWRSNEQSYTWVMSTIWGFLRPFGSDCTIFFWTLRWSSFWLVQSYSIHEKKNIFGCWLIPVIFRRTHHNSPFFCSEIPLFSMLNRWKSLGLRRRARGRPTIHVTRHVGGHPEIARERDSRI